MKTERRHELQKNDLADYLGKYVQLVQPYLKWVGIAALVVVLLLIIGSIVSRRSAAGLAEAWSEYIAAQLAEDPRKSLEDVASVYDDTPAGMWAQQTRASLNLNQASRLMYTQRDEADRLLDEALEGFQGVAGQARNPFLQQHALYGLAMTYEMQGELNKARDTYEDVVAKAGRSALAERAQERLDRLNNSNVREFYAWFSEQEMTAPAGPSNLPRDLSELPDFPNLGLPPAPTGEVPAAPTAPATGEVPAPATGEVPAPATGEPSEQAAGDPAAPDADPDDAPPGESEPAADSDSPPADNTEEAADEPAADAEPDTPAEPAAEQPEPAADPATP